VVRFVQTTGRNQSRRGRALEAFHERMRWAARQAHLDLPARILAVLRDAGRPLTSGQLHQAISQGKPLAVLRPRLYEALKAPCDGGQLCRSGKPGEYQYRLPS
jgi:hypothetical protein